MSDVSLRYDRYHDPTDEARALLYEAHDVVDGWLTEHAAVYMALLALMPFCIYGLAKYLYHLVMYPRRVR